MAYVLPASQSIGKKWTHQFIQWCFGGVIGSFFLYLTQVLMDNVSGLIGTPSTMIVTQGPSITGQISELTLMAIPLIFLAAGAMVTMSTSAMGASFITGAAKKWGSKAAGGLTNWGKTRMQRDLRVAGERIIPQNVRENLERMQSKTYGWGQGRGGMGGWMQRRAAGAAGVLTRRTGATIEKVTGGAAGAADVGPRRPERRSRACPVRSNSTCARASRRRPSVRAAGTASCCTP